MVESELACGRCGYTRNLESHHITHKIDGGGEEPENKQWLCTYCHDYQHAKETVLKAIIAEKARLSILEKRLEIIERENTIENILQVGYQPYFKIFSELMSSRTWCGRQ